MVVTTPNEYDSYNHGYDFLTPERQEALSRALQDAAEQFRHVAMSTPAYKDMTRADSTRILLSIMHGAFIQAHKGVQGVVVTFIGKVFSIIYDGVYVIHLKKALNPETIVNVPKAMHGLTLQVQQPEYVDQVLPGFEGYVKTITADAYVLAGVYLTDESNVLDQFWINDQQGTSIIRSEYVPLDTTVIQYPSSENTHPNIDFNFRDEDIQEGDIEIDVEDTGILNSERKATNPTDDMEEHDEDAG